MQVNMHEAKAQLSKLAKLAWQGEEVIIAKSGKPFLKLVPYEEPAAPEPEPEAAPEPEKRERRPLGLLKGQIWMAPDFDETDEEIIEAFEGKWSTDSDLF